MNLLICWWSLATLNFRFTLFFTFFSFFSFLWFFTFFIVWAIIIIWYILLASLDLYLLVRVVLDSSNMWVSDIDYTSIQTSIPCMTKCLVLYWRIINIKAFILLNLPYLLALGITSWLLYVLLNHFGFFILFLIAINMRLISLLVRTKFIRFLLIRHLYLM